MSPDPTPHDRLRTLKEWRALRPTSATDLDWLIQYAESLQSHNLTLTHALNRSVSLQSHYASQLNIADGGTRLTFKTGTDWIKRLDDLEHSRHA